MFRNMTLISKKALVHYASWNLAKKKNENLVNEFVNERERKIKLGANQGELTDIA